MIIKVTHQHINNARYYRGLSGLDYGNRDYCPIALAIKESSSEHVEVGSNMIYFRIDYAIPLPDIACQFIKQFDRELWTGSYTVLPFEFEIEDNIV